MQSWYLRFELVRVMPSICFIVITLPLSAAGWYLSHSHTQTYPSFLHKELHIFLPKISLKTHFSPHIYIFFFACVNLLYVPFLCRLVLWRSPFSSILPLLSMLLFVGKRSWGVGCAICYLSLIVVPTTCKMWVPFQPVGFPFSGAALGSLLGDIPRNDPCHHCQWRLWAYGFKHINWAKFGVALGATLAGCPRSNHTRETNQVGRKTQRSLQASIFQWVQPSEPKCRVNPHPAGRAGKETSCPKNPRQQHQQKAALPVGAGRRIRQQRSPQGLVSFRSFVLQIARLVWGYSFFFNYFLFSLKRKKRERKKEATPRFCWQFLYRRVMCGVCFVVVFVTLGTLQIYLLISVNEQFQTFRLAHFCVFI